MTVPEKSQRKRITVSGFANPLTHDVYLESEAHLKVYADAALLALGVDYTVGSLRDPAGYTVTMTLPISGTPTHFVLSVEPPLEQANDVSLGGVFGARFENALDDLTRRVQSVDDGVSRALKMPKTTQVGTEYEVPAPVASKVIGWNAAATALQLFDNPGAASLNTAADLVAVTALAEAVEVDLLAVEAERALAEEAAAQAAGTLVLANAAIGSVFVTPALLLADAAFTYANTVADQLFHTRVGGFTYKLALTGAVDHHLVTAGGLKLYALPDGKGALWAEQFNADMTGATSSTAKLQALLDAAAAKQCDVRCGAGTIMCGKLTVLGGVGNIDFTQAEWVGLGIALLPQDTAGRMEFSGFNTRQRNVAVRMNMANGDLIAITGVIKKTSFKGTEIYGYTNHATINHIGIRIDAGSDDVDVEKVNWTGYTNPTQRGLGVQCTGTVAGYGGYLPANATVRATVPVTNLRIHDCTFLQGSYAWVPNGTEYSTFYDNYCDGQNHRVVQFTAGCYRCGVYDNIMKDFRSSAVLFSYGSTDCWAVDNLVDVVTNWGGEAAFNINTGAARTLVQGNRGYANCNYFVYVATGSNGTIVKDNVGEGFYLAGVCLQSNWSDPADGSQVNNIFDRSNFGSVTGFGGGFTEWAFADLTGVVVEGNKMGNGSRANRAAYAVVQMRGETGTAYGVTATFRNNSVHNTTNISYDLSVFRDNGTIALTLEDNDFREGAYFHRADTTGARPWNEVVTYFRNNRGLDMIMLAEAVNLAVNSTTPSVVHNGPKNQERLFTFANTAPTSVTDFTGQFANQIIKLRLDTNTTLVYNAALLRLKGAVNVSGRGSSDFIWLQKVGSVWIETGRNW